MSKESFENVAPGLCQMQQASEVGLLLV